MVAKKLFGVCVHLFYTRHKKQIYTNFLGLIYVFAHLVENENFPKETLRFAIMHERFHQIQQRLILLVLLALALLIIYLILINQYLIATIIFIIFIILWASIIVLLSILGRKLEVLADLHAVKILGKEESKKAILDLYKRGIIVEDKKHGNIDYRIAELDR